MYAIKEYDMLICNQVDFSAYPFMTISQVTVMGRKTERDERQR